MLLTAVVVATVTLVVTLTDQGQKCCHFTTFDRLRPSRWLDSRRLATFDARLAEEHVPFWVAHQVDDEYHQCLGVLRRALGAPGSWGVSGDWRDNHVGLREERARLGDMPFADFHPEQ